MTLDIGDSVTTRRSIMTLYSDPRSIYSHRVRMVMEEKHLVYEVEDIDPENLPEEVVELSPYGVTPVLADRDLSLFDSRIIMEYLDERFPHPPLLPIDPVSRAKFRLYMHRVEKDWYSCVDTILEGGRPAIKARKELVESLTTAAPVFEANPFFMGEEFSLIDASIAPLLWRLPYLGIELGGNVAKSINGYAARLFKKKSFIKSLTEEEREMRQ